MFGENDPIVGQATFGLSDPVASPGAAPRRAAAAPPQPQAPPPESLLQGFNRGFASLLDIPSRLITEPAKMLGAPVETRPFTRLAEMGGMVPEPGTVSPSLQGRVGESFGGSAVPAAGIEIAAARTAPAAANRLLQAVQNAPWAWRGGEAASALGSGVGQHVGAESGLPGGEMIGAMAGGLAPAAAAGLTRAAARGGPAGGQAMRENLETFQQADVSPMLGQVAPSGGAKYVDKMAQSLGAGTWVRDRLLRRQAEEAQSGLTKITEDMNPQGLDPTAAGARGGRALQGSIDRFQDTAGRLYGYIDKVVPEQTPVRLDNFRGMLEGIQGRSADTSELRRAFAPDAMARIQAAIEDTADAVSYSGARELRTTIGASLKDSLLSDLPNAQLKRLYGALSDDITESLVRASPTGLRAQRTADNFYRQGIERIEDTIKPILGSRGQKDADQIFRSIESSIRTPAKLARLRREMGPEAFRESAGLVLENMGRSSPGTARTADDFSMQQFFSRWEKLPERSKRMLAHSSQHMEDLDALTKVAERARDEMQTMGNPSRSGERVGTIAPALIGSLYSPDSALWATLGPGVAASVLNSGPVMRWLARASRVPVTQLPRYANMLIEDLAEEEPEIEAAGEQLVDALLSQFEDQ